MSVIDLALVVSLVASAGGFLGWNLLVRGAKPACHTTGGKKKSEPAGDVIVGASLARGLARAQQRRHPAPHTTR